MTTNAVDFRTQTNRLLEGAIVAHSAAVKRVWDGMPLTDAQKPTSTESWVRISVQHVGGGQASLAGADGRRRWRRNGFVSIQAFVPLKKGGVKGALQLACAARDALQGNQTLDCAWFRNARINEVGEHLDWYQVNATIDFEYDEVK